MKQSHLTTILWIGLLLTVPGHPSADAQTSVPRNSSIWINEGFIEPIEDIEVAVSDMGIIDQVLVKPGVQVKQNQLLATLDSSVLQANLKTALARSRGTAKLRAAEIEYQTQKTRFEKVTELLNDGAARPEEVERAKANADVAHQEITAIREQNEIYSWEVKELEARIEQRNIRSPIDGVVIDVYKKPGEHVSSNDALVARVVDLRKLRVIFHVPTVNALSARVNQTVELLVPETNQQITATIEYVSPITRADSGRVRIDMLVDNPERTIRSGLRCRILDPNLSHAKRSQPLHR